MTDSRPSSTEHPPAALSAPRQEAVFIRKELRETLRDRRTLVTLLAMPLLLYPLLGMVFRFLAIQQAGPEKVLHRIAVATDQEATWLANALKEGDRAYNQMRLAVDENSRPVSDPPKTTGEVELRLFVPENDGGVDLRSLIAGGGADVGVRAKLPEAGDTKLFQQADVQLIRAEGSVTSRNATLYVQERLRALNIAVAQHWAEQAEREFRLPIRERIDMVAPKGQANVILGVLPLVLLLMTVTGGVYPAIDLTAGERERDTLETLMALPVSRARLLFAKYVAVVTVTLLTGLVNLIVMALTVYSLQLDRTLFGAPGLTVGLGVRLLAVLLVFSLFYSAVLLLLTSSARSFKEAQAYLIPLMLLSITPGLVSLMPGWRLSTLTMALPLMNMLLLAKELLEGTATLFPAIVAVATTLVYAGAALLMAARIFGTDAVMTGSRGAWTDLFDRPKSFASLPTMGQVFTTLALTYPAYFFVSGILGRFGDMPIAARLAVSGLFTILLFAGLPMLALLWRRVALASGLRLHDAPPLVWPAAVILGLSTWPWVYEIVLLMQSAGLQALGADKIAQVETLLAQWRSVPVVVTVVALGVIPGVCEELFFRGFFLAGLRPRLAVWPAILVAAVTFGLFHVVLAGGAAPERLVPSTLMGILLGWVACRTGSVLPSMLLHVIHNSTLLTMASFRDELLRLNIGTVDQTHLPVAWLGLSAAGLLVGVLTVSWATRPSSKPTELATVPL